MGIAILVAVIAAGVALRPNRGQGATTLESSAAAPLSRGPSIAVLPFSNASGDPNQDYFSNGLTEELITELSKFQELFVAARASILKYKDKAVDVREIGDSLGVRYVLQGSVQKAGENIRMTAELSDTSDGRRLWGESYDASLSASDFFDLQDELTQQVVREIAGSFGALFQAEFAQARRKPPASLESYDCVLRVYQYLQIHTPENHLAARACLEQVVPTDTDYVDGKAWLGYIYSEEFHHRYNERVGEYDALDRALELGTEAVQLDTVSQVAHGTLALTAFLRGDFDGGILEARRAIDINPRSALWLATLGLYLAQTGDFENAIPVMRDAVALSPHPPTWYGMVFFFDHYFNGRYEEALVEARQMDWNGDFRLPLFVAATYGQLGRLEEAAEVLAELLALWPRPAEDLRAEFIERHAFSPELTDRLMQGLAKAGMQGLSGGTE